MNLPDIGHAKANEGGGELDQAFIAVGAFFIPDEELSEAVHPGMGAFHGPPEGQVSFLVGGAALHQDGNKSPLLCHMGSGFAGVPFVSRNLGNHSRRKVDHDRIQNRTDFLGIMPVGGGDDHREGSAAAVGEEMALGSFFFPGRWGCRPLLPGPAGP